MTIWFVLLISLVGLVVYAVSTNPKLSEIGRILFWTGMLAFLLGYHGQAITVVK